MTIEDASSESGAHRDGRNRLAGETSPYLLQHARNPVDWYPWGDEALQRARTENKPIFLSIGYSACHWCHVMERESFENADVAHLLNRHFISIKVDREERPDLDAIYMTAVQMMSGSGGWPMSVFLTPDLKPFFGGTYFPPDDQPGHAGFKTVLARLAEFWEKRQDELRKGADEVIRAIAAQIRSAPATDTRLDRSLVTRAVRELTQSFDSVWGGFGGAPKFPPSGAIAVLFRDYARTREPATLRMATLTLDRMAFGGLYDQLGGGFHRYSVDERWLVPHFEKMLYDNALLATAYLEAWQVTGLPRYRQVAGETLDYLLREMTDPDGGFYSSEDADSPAGEGAFYAWSRQDVLHTLGEKDGSLFCDYYGVSEGGPLEGADILHIPEEPARFARERGLEEGVFVQGMRELRKALLVERNKRPRPGKDRKILTSWNGLAISAMAKGAQILGEERFAAAATRAARFLLAHARDGRRLTRSYCGGRSGQSGYLDDYACLIDGLIDLYETAFDLEFLRTADDLAAVMIEEFQDEKRGGFFFTSAAHGDLPVRTKPWYDGAEPSGNSMAARVLLRLGRLLDRKAYVSKAEDTLKTFAGMMAQAPRGALNMLCVLDFLVGPVHEIGVAGRRKDADTRALLQTLHRFFLPHRVLAGLDPAAADEAATLIPFLEGRISREGRATVYVCENATCREPVSQPEELIRQLVRLTGAEAVTSSRTSAL